MSLDIKWFLFPPHGGLAEIAETAIRNELHGKTGRVVLTQHKDAWDVRLMGQRDAVLRHHLVARLRAAGLPAVALAGVNHSNVTITWSSARPDNAALVEEIVMGVLARPYDWPDRREWRNRVAGLIHVTFKQTERLSAELAYHGDRSPSAMSAEEEAVTALTLGDHLVEALRSEGFPADPA